MGYFELLNGFRKTLYMSKEEMLNHADTYSKAFNKKDYERLQAGQIPEKDLWKYSSFWYKNFDTMAFKTLLRQLISKWGIMSIELQDAFAKDMAVIRDDGNIDYVDNDDEETIISDVEPIEDKTVNDEVNLDEVE